MIKQSDSFVRTRGHNATDTDGSKDCALRALSLAFNTDYDYIYYKLKDLGRKDGKGTYRHHSLQVITDICNLLGFKQTIFNLEQLGVRIGANEFCRTYNTGRYICYVPRHVFTVIDGKRHDTYESNELVLIGIKLEGDFSKHITLAPPTVEPPKDIEFHFDF